MTSLPAYTGTDWLAMPQALQRKVIKLVVAEAALRGVDWHRDTANIRVCLRRLRKQAKAQPTRRLLNIEIMQHMHELGVQPLHGGKQ